MFRILSHLLQTLRLLDLGTECRRVEGVMGGEDEPIPKPFLDAFAKLRK